MKRILLLITAFSALTVNGQTMWWLADFEDPVLGTDTAWYGQDQVTDGDTLYTSGSFTFELSYDSGWDSFTGFAVSSETDNVTPGFGNQFSAITGGGYNGSDQYGICYVTPWTNNRVFLTDGMWFTNFYITNTTYAYYSMLNGDAFAKPFGADTSAAGVIDGTNGEDWFLLTIYGLNSDTLYTGDSVNVYLADYTFADSSQDYILDTWQFVGLGGFDETETYGLDFVLTSSDTSGGFGMNTPAYFAIDNFDAGAEGLFDNPLSQIRVFPNPTEGDIRIETEPNAVLRLYDINGRLVKETVTTSAQEIWDLNELESGMYTLISILDDRVGQSRIIKE